MLTSKEIGNFKRVARQAYKLGELSVQSDWNRTEAQQIKMDERLEHLDSKIEDFEERMSDDQRADLEIWVGDNQLWGLLNIC